jgi:hypothetical protein
VMKKEKAAVVAKPPVCANTTARKKATGVISSSNGSFHLKSVSSANQGIKGPLTQLKQKELQKQASILTEQELDEALSNSTLEDYQMMNLLGKGAYASTFLAQHKATGASVAMKIYTYNDKNHLKESIESEIKILGKVVHPNVVKMHQSFDRPNKTIICLE